jgi:hypothetical protein
MQRRQSILQHYTARLLILSLMCQGLLSSLVSAQQPPVPVRPEAARWRSIDEIPRVTAKLDTRQKMLVGIYLTASERERVAIAADYIADQNRRTWTSTQRAYVQSNYDRQGLNFTVGSFEERRWFVDILVKSYDQAHERYGPDVAVKEWMDTVSDPGKLARSISMLAIEPLSKKAAVGLVLNMGVDYMLDQNVGKGLRQSAQSLLEAYEVTNTRSLRLATSIVSDPTYLPGASRVLEGFVRPELIEYFNPDADLPRLLDRIDMLFGAINPRPRTARTAKPRTRPRDYFADSVSIGDIKILVDNMRDASDVPRALTATRPPAELRYFDDAQMAFAGVGLILSLSNEPGTRKLGRQISQLSAAVFPAAKALATRGFGQTAGNIVTKNAPLTPIAAAGTIGIVVIALVTTVQILSEQNAQSETAILAGMLGQLSQQISRLQEDMHSRFERVDLRLDALLTEVRAGLTRLINTGQLSLIQLTQVTRQLDSFAEILNDISIKLAQVPDVVATELIRDRFNSCQASATATPDACARELLAFIVDTRERVAKRDLSVPQRIASGPQLDAFDRAIRSGVSEQGLDYPLLSALLALSALAGDTPETSRIEPLAYESKTNLNPQVLSFAIDKLRRLPSSPSEAALRKELDSVVAQYQFLHDHFAKHFESYARYLLERHNGYREQYAAEVNRLFMRAIGEVQNGLKFSRLVPQASIESLEFKSAAGIERAQYIKPCEQDRQDTLISTNDLESYIGGPYELPSRLRKVEPLFKLAESLGIGSLEPFCFEVAGGWKEMKRPGVVVPSTIWFRQSFVRRWNYAVPYDQGVKKPFFVVDRITMDFAPDDLCVRACFPSFENGRDQIRTLSEGRKVSLPIREAWLCAFRSAAPHCGPQRNAFQARLSKDEIAGDPKSNDQLRDVVAARLIAVRNDVLDAVARRASQEIRDNRTAIGQAVRGMSAFQHMLEELAWFVYGRRLSLIGPAAAFGRAAWPLDVETFGSALESGERLGEFLVSPVQRIAFDGGSTEDQRAAVGQRWLLQTRAPKSPVESVLSDNPRRTWAAVFDPLGALDIGGMITRSKPTDKFGDGLRPELPDFIILMQGKLSALDFLRLSAVPVAR